MPLVICPTECDCNWIKPGSHIWNVSNRHSHWIGELVENETRVFPYKDSTFTGSTSVPCKQNWWPRLPGSPDRHTTALTLAWRGLHFFGFISTHLLVCVTAFFKSLIVWSQVQPDTSPQNACSHIVKMSNEPATNDHSITVCPNQICSQNSSAENEVMPS